MKKIFLALTISIIMITTHNAFAMDEDQEKRPFARQFVQSYEGPEPKSRYPSIRTLFSNLDPRSWSSSTKLVLGGLTFLMLATASNAQCTPEIDFMDFTKNNQLFHSSHRLSISLPYPPSNWWDMMGVGVEGCKECVDYIYTNLYSVYHNHHFALRESGVHQLILEQITGNTTHVTCQHRGTAWQQCGGWGPSIPTDYPLSLAFRK